MAAASGSKNKSELSIPKSVGLFDEERKLLKVSNGSCTFNQSEEISHLKTLFFAHK